MNINSSAFLAYIILLYYAIKKKWWYNKIYVIENFIRKFDMFFNIKLIGFFSLLLLNHIILYFNNKKQKNFCIRLIKFLFKTYYKFYI